MDRRGLLEELDFIVLEELVILIAQKEDLRWREIAERIVDKLQDHPNLLARFAIRAQNAELERERNEKS